MFLQPEVLVLVFTLAGFTLKLTDLAGERRRGFLPYLVAGFSGFLFGMLISESGFSSAIMLGITVGVALSAKIDKLNLVFGLVTALFTAVVVGFSQPHVWLLLIVSLFAFIDEWGHDKFGKNGGVLASFFHYRGCLKLVIVLLALFSFLPITYAIGFLLFDLSYDLTHVLVTKWIMGSATLPRD